ncbi:hypothetical protein [Streptomyces sp. A3M-1-3]|uniref:hypothetical protein n=1 Tax=Streptomyces sp. A3M-1-3 TaxID=2962044 RepID=UPI0035ABE166
MPGQEERQAYYRSKCDKLSEALGISDPQEAAQLLFALIAIASWPFIVEQQRRLMLGPASGTDEGRARLRKSIAEYGQVLIDSARGR